jgi:IS5 family transposase
MSQMGFFDISNRYAGLDVKKDPLAKIDEVVRWEDFRPSLEAVWAPVQRN